MKLNEVKQLNIGDLVTPAVGVDKGVICKVMNIEFPKYHETGEVTVAFPMKKSGRTVYSGLGLYNGDEVELFVTKDTEFCLR